MIPFQIFYKYWFCMFCTLSRSCQLSWFQTPLITWFRIKESLHLPQKLEVSDKTWRLLKKLSMDSPSFCILCQNTNQLLILLVIIMVYSSSVSIILWTMCAVCVSSYTREKFSNLLWYQTQSNQGLSNTCINTRSSSFFTRHCEKHLVGIM